MQRRYLQGTLDFSCGIYAVINALGCTHGLNLAGGRSILQETLIAFAEAPLLWTPFLRNETDHYWVIRYMLRRWCSDAPWKLRVSQPFSDALLPDPPFTDATDLARQALYLPEAEAEAGPPDPGAAEEEATAVWRALEEWFAKGKEGQSNRPALLRFHRFLFHGLAPVVSHWTTAWTIRDGALLLHDASSEREALMALERSSLLPGAGEPALLRIVPESLVFLEAGPSGKKRSAKG